MSGGDLPEALYLPEAVLRPAGRESRAARCVARSRLDPEQFGKVFSDYFAEIHGYVARRLGSDTADDIAAATFETALTKRLGFDPTLCTVRAWRYGIATRHIASRHRDADRRCRALERVPAPPPAERLLDAVASRRPSAA